MKHDVYIGLGSNLGDREAALRKAMVLLEQSGMEIVGVSHFIETPPAFILDQPDFINACAHLRTDLGPEQVLETLLLVESKMGRVRTVDKGPRTIDLDLLFFDSIIRNGEFLTLPHPGVLERDFVLIPLAEIAPNLIHPIAKITIEKALEGLVPGDLRLFVTPTSGST